MNTTTTQPTALFQERTTCISCNNQNLLELSSGRFDEGAVKRFIDEDPWGENPAPFLRGKPWSFVKCQECGQKFHRYILESSWNERRFSKWMSKEAIESFESRFKTAARTFEKAATYTAHILQIEKLTRKIRGADRLRVLDFGCGYGGFISMCTLFGFEAYGVDRSSHRREGEKTIKIFAEIEDVVDLAPFHVLTLFEVLEHLDDPARVVLELRDLVADGGILVLETPDCSGVKDILTRNDYLKIHPLEHINAFSPKTLDRFASRIGFKRISKPAVLVAADFGKMLKRTGKNLLAPFIPPTTRMYFTKQ